MKIIVDYPPNFDRIDEVFGPLTGKPILYAYGDTIYNPKDVVIQPELIAHEEVHGARQTDIESWWDQYIKWPAFRLQEEILAHRAEYDHLTGSQSNRNDRRRALKHVANRLAAPLYGRMITVSNAKKELKAP